MSSGGARPERADRGHAPGHRLLRHVDQFGRDRCARSTPPSPRRTSTCSIPRSAAAPRGAASGKMAIWVGGDEQQFNRHKTGARRDGRPGRLYRPDRRRHDRQARAQLHQRGAGRRRSPRSSRWASRPGSTRSICGQAVRQGATGRLRTFDRLGESSSQASYDPADFALRLLHKDVSLAVGLGSEVGVPMRLANLALEELTEAMNRGWGTAQQHASASCCRSSVRRSTRPRSIRTRSPPSSPTTTELAFHCEERSNETIPGGLAGVRIEIASRSLPSDGATRRPRGSQ